jgi:hypothetical protein
LRAGKAGDRSNGGNGGGDGSGDEAVQHGGLRHVLSEWYWQNGVLRNVFSTRSDEE